jgi:hypothetical protein
MSGVFSPPFAPVCYFTTLSSSCGSVVSWGTTPRVGKSRLPFPTSTDLTPPATLSPWGGFSFYQKWLPRILVRSSQRVRLTVSLPLLCQLSIKCGSLDVPQRYGPLRSVLTVFYSVCDDASRRTIKHWHLNDRRMYLNRRYVKGSSRGPDEAFDLKTG